MRGELPDPQEPTDTTLESGAAATTTRTAQRPLAAGLPRREACVRPGSLQLAASLMYSGAPARDDRAHAFLGVERRDPVSSRLRNFESHGSFDSTCLQRCSFVIDVREDTGNAAEPAPALEGPSRADCDDRHGAKQIRA